MDGCNIGHWLWPLASSRHAAPRRLIRTMQCSSWDCMHKCPMAMQGRLQQRSTAACIRTEADPLTCNLICSDQRHCADLEEDSCISFNCIIRGAFLFQHLKKPAHGCASLPTNSEIPKHMQATSEATGPCLLGRQSSYLREQNCRLHQLAKVNSGSIYCSRHKCKAKCTDDRAIQHMAASTA